MMPSGADDGALGGVLLTQAAVDPGDFAVQAWPVVRGEGIARGAGGGALAAAAGVVLWSRLARSIDAA